MPVTLEEIRKIISDNFQNSDVNQVVQDGYQIFGTIVWEGFRKCDVAERNRLVSERIRNKLGLRGINVGILFPLAPGEKL